MLMACAVNHNLGYTPLPHPFSVKSAQMAENRGDRKKFVRYLQQNTEKECGDCRKCWGYTYRGAQRTEAVR